MKCKIDCAGYNTLLQPTDWRYAAAIVGLIRYLEFHNIKYTCLSDIGDRPPEAIVGFDGILYNSEDVTAERYLLFVESFFQSDMTHLSILNALEESEFDAQKSHPRKPGGLKLYIVIKKLFLKLAFNAS